MRSGFEAEELEALKVIGIERQGMSVSFRTRCEWERVEEVMWTQNQPAQARRRQMSTGAWPVKAKHDTSKERPAKGRAGQGKKRQMDLAFVCCRTDSQGRHRV